MCGWKRRGKRWKPLLQSTRMTGYDTIHDTNAQPEGARIVQVVENDGRPEWIRTIDLFRVKEAL